MEDIFSAIRKPLTNMFAGAYAAINAKFDTLDTNLESIIETALPTALGTALPTALDAALPAALETAVPAAVEEAVPDAVAAIIKKGGTTLNGLAYTPVLFGDDSAATLESTVTGPFDISGVGDGGTLILNIDGDGEQTATVNYTKGKSVSGAKALRPTFPASLTANVVPLTAVAIALVLNIATTFLFGADPLTAFCDAFIGAGIVVGLFASNDTQSNRTEIRTTHDQETIGPEITE